MTAGQNQAAVEGGAARADRLQFLRFAVAGGLAAGANWLSGRVLETWLELSLAVPLAYLVGMTVAFALTRKYVFGRSGRSLGEEYARFAAVNAVALLIVWGVTVGLARYAFPAIGFSWRADAVAHAIGIAAPIGPSYLLHRWFTFAPKRETA